MELADLKILDHKVTSVPQFSVVALLNLTLKPSSEFPSTEKIDHALSGITDRPVWVRLSKRFRAVQKSIQSIEVVARTDSSLKLKIYCDGGIPLKKLVTGQEGSVEPNLSGILGNFEIDRAEPFDILEVKFKQSEKPASIGNDVLEAESRFSDIGLTE